MNMTKNSKLKELRLQNNLGFLLNGLARLMRNELENRLREVSISPTAWSVLLTLDESEGRSQSDLARSTFLDGATVTRVLDRLEDKGFIERKRGDDRRVHFVTLTNDGKAMTQKVIAYGEEVNKAAARLLSVGERDQFTKTVKTMINQFQSI